MLLGSPVDRIVHYVFIPFEIVRIGFLKLSSLSSEGSNIRRMYASFSFMLLSLCFSYWLIASLGLAVGSIIELVAVLFGTVDIVFRCADILSSISHFLSAI